MKKLLNLNFATLSGDSLNFGCDCPNTPFNIKQYSEENPMKLVGGMLRPFGQNSYQTSDYANHKLFKKLGYGARVVIPKSSTFLNVPYYLNGVQQDEDGVNMPYIYFNDLHQTIYHFGGDSTQEINIYDVAPNTQPPEMTIEYNPESNTVSNGCNIYTGYIDIDGCLTGGWNICGAKKIMGSIYSKKYYYWQTIVKTYRYRVININVINDLKEYMPIEPEGEFVAEGVGDFDASSDRIDLPELPNASALATGMIKIFKMTTLGLTSLNNYLWSDLFDLNTFKKMFSDPMQAILNLSISPIDVTVGGRSYIKIGNISTDVSGEICTSQYQKKDFGTIRLNEYWANFADYSPYTKLNIYLPYIGIQPLNIDDVMNGNLHLVGYLDVLTGSIVYNLFSEQKNHAEHGHQSVLYSWAGNCQYQIPLTANNMSSVISSIASSSLTVVGGIATTKASGGLTAPVVAHTVGSVVSNTLNAKQQTQRGGGVGGANGIFGVQFPYLILERPEQRTIADFNSQIGLPTEKSGALGSFNGLVKVKAVRVNYVEGATETEKAEIERLLKEGVII